MRVERLTDEEEWERFVAATSGGSFYHTLKWKKVLEEGHGLETFYLVVRDSLGELAGVCPFAMTRKGKLVKILNSLPYSDFGGPLFRERDAAEAASALKDYLSDLARSQGISYAIIRCAGEDVANYLRTKETTVGTSAGTMNLDLTECPVDYIWKEVFTAKGKERTKLKWFERAGFVNMLAQDSNDLKAFYRLYNNNMNYIKASPYPFSFFEKAWELLYPEYFNIMLTAKDANCIGGQAFFIYPQKRAVYQTYVGLDRNVDTHYHSYFYYLCWGLIKWAENNGFNRVSLGGTPADPGSINYRGKSKFGATFNQDFILYLPFDRKVFLLREGIFKLGRIVDRWLPSDLSHKLHKTARGL